MSPIQDLQIIYKSLNKGDTFSAGDTVEGAVTFTLRKKIEVKSVLVKLKGEARVRWTEKRGDDRRVRTDSRRYFKVKEYLVAESTNGKTTCQKPFQISSLSSVNKSSVAPLIWKVTEGEEVIAFTFSGIVLPHGVHRFDFKLRIPQG